MTSAYIIANVEVTNPTQYEDYKKWSTEAMKAHGAEVCVRGGKVEVLEGDWHPERIVIAEVSERRGTPRHSTTRPNTARRATRAPGRRGHAT